MIKNNVDTKEMGPNEPSSLISYLTEGSVLWVLVAGMILLIIALKFFAPW